MKLFIIIGLIISFCAFLSSNCTSSESTLNSSDKDRASRVGDSASAKNTKSKNFCPDDVPDEDNEDAQCRSDSDCKSGCRDFFNSGEYECFELPEDTGKKMVDVLDALEENKFSSLKDDEDMESLCLAVKIDEESWYDIIKSYSSRKAKEALNWIADNKNVTDMIMDMDDSISEGIFKGLLSQAGGSFNGDPGDVTDDDLLKGLEDSSDRFLEEAVKEGNYVLVNFIHEFLVQEEICYASEDNFEGAVSGCGSSTCYTSEDKKEADDRKKEACYLAVYCQVLSGGNKSRARRDLAEMLNNDDIDDFINDDRVSGGLQVESRDNPSEWSDAVCNKLKDLWNYKGTEGVGRLRSFIGAS